MSNNDKNCLINRKMREPSSPPIKELHGQANVECCHVGTSIFWYFVTAYPWSSSLEGDEQLDWPNRRTCME